MKSPLSKSEMKSPHFIPFLIFTTVFFFDLSSANANPNPPSFSHPSGFYTTEFQLELTSDDPDAVILFTLDGSLPNPAHLNGASYQLKNSVDGPFTIRQMQTYEYESSSSIFLYNRTEETNQVSAIPTHWYLFRSPSYSVPKGIVVRATTLRDGELSEIVTNVYFVGEEFEAFLDLGVLSIAIQEDHFWGYENGINVPGSTFDPDAALIWYNNGNYYQRGREWERPVHVELFDQDGTSGFSQQAGIRIHGGTSRWMVNRSLRLYARSDYGQNTIDYPLFAQRGFQRHKRLKLRTSGQDYEYTYFRDALMSRLMMESEMTVEEYRPVNLFINGEYWGITNIRERFDAHYAERNFGIPREEVEIGSTPHYREFRNYILNHNASEEEYYDDVSKRIYLDSLLDLKIAEIFFGRWDMHWEQWRDGRDPENRWRWVMWDFDVGMDLPEFQPPRRADWTGSTTEPAVSMDYLRPFLTDYRTRGDRNEEFSLIMKNPQIRDRFLTRLAMMMSSNLGKQRMIGEINTIQEKLRNTMPLHIQRWGALSRGIHTMVKWEDEIERLRFFSTHRQGYVYQHAIDFFELEGLANIKILKPSPGGSIHLFDEDLEQLIQKSGTEEATEWTGTLFRGLPIRVEAKATPGYRFAGWSEPFEEHGPILEFTLEADLTIHARFERVTGEPGDALNPLPHRLAESDYLFDFWAADTPEGEFPPHMVFLQSSVSDPGLDEIMTHPYSIPFTDIEENDYNPDDYEHIGFPYRLTRRTRINGLDERGISMINTGRGRDLGSVILALDTRNVEQASLSWVAETLQLNSRVYYLRLRYRTSVEEEWNDFKDSFGNLIEFRSDAGAGETRFGDLRLPDELMEQAYLQLEWRYYHTGERRNMESGARDEIRLDQIEVRTDGSEYQTRRINAFPNPFSREVTLAFDSQTEERGWIEVYTITGRRVKRVELSSSSAGERRQTLNFTGLSSGTYLIRVIQDDDVTHHTIQYIR